MTKYRLAVKNVALTYPKCDLTKEEVLEKLRMKLKGNLEDYLISQELHEDGTKHIHAWVKLHKLVNIKDPHYFDLDSYHGNYQSVKSKGNWLSYITKEKNYITNLYWCDGKLISFYEGLVSRVRENRLDLALIELDQHKVAKDILLNYTKYRKNLIELNKNINTSVDESKYNVSDYDYPQEIIDWLKDKGNRTLVLEGDTNTGKTQGMLALLKEFNPKLIREINDLKKLTPLNRAAIYDDLDLSKLYPDTVKHLFDGEVDGVIRVLYGSVTIDASIKKVWLINLFRLKETEKSHLDAINRRITHVILKKPLVKSVIYRERELEVKY